MGSLLGRLRACGVRKKKTPLHSSPVVKRIVVSEENLSRPAPLVQRVKGTPEPWLVGEKWLVS